MFILNKTPDFPWHEHIVIFLTFIEVSISNIWIHVIYMSENIITKSYFYLNELSDAVVPVISQKRLECFHSEGRQPKSVRRRRREIVIDVAAVGVIVAVSISSAIIVIVIIVVVVVVIIIVPIVLVYVGHGEHLASIALG